MRVATTLATACLLSCHPPLPRRCGAAPRLAETATATTRWPDLTEEAKRLTDAQIARTVAAVTCEGVLVTHLDADGADGDGAPFPSAAPFVLGADGSPLTPVASTEVAGNLQKARGATFYARAPRGGAAASSVLCVIGEMEDVAVDEVSDAQLMGLASATGESTEALAARAWMRLVPRRVHINDAVRGVEAWVPVAEYRDASPNPLAESSPTILKKMNKDHAAALRRFAAVYAGTPPAECVAAELLSVDQLGFDMRVQLNVNAPTTLLRIGFAMPPANEEEGTSLFMKLFQEAYERENGFM